MKDLRNGAAKTRTTDTTMKPIPRGDRSPMGKYQLKLLGAFLLVAPDGRRIPISSKKGIALLGLLATAGSGERWRSWIQAKLWGSRELAQAQASLRRELHILRSIGMDAGFPLIEANYRVARLLLDNIDVDIRTLSRNDSRSEEFLEGIDVAGEEGFDEWLNAMRRGFRMPALPAILSRRSSRPVFERPEVMRH